MSQPTIGVVLAAGGSTRMGQAKALLDVCGRPLLLRHVEAFHANGLPVRVVLGAAAESIRGLLATGVEVRVNEAWATTTPADSAWLALADGRPALLTPVDVPPVRPDVLAALLHLSQDAVPCFDGRDGHPVRLWPPHVAGRLDARLRGARRVPVDDAECVLNLNTPAEWEAWLPRARLRWPTDAAAATQ